jgi:hypothetical protein
MAKKTLLDSIKTIVDELTPLGSDDRKRAIQAAMTVLGEEAIRPVQPEPVPIPEAENLPLRVRNWMRQNDISMQQLQQVFHIENGTAEIIAEIPGRNNKEKVRNAYVLTGISNFLVAGEQRFDDVAARALCERFGLYDSTNHAKYVKGGNEFTGSRERGWTVTIPGLKAAATLIKDIDN